MKTNFNNNRLNLIDDTFIRDGENIYPSVGYYYLCSKLNSDLYDRNICFETQVNPLLKNLFNYALDLSRNKEDADLLFINTYIRAYRFFSLYNKSDDFRKWLNLIMRNCFINSHRKNKEQGKTEYTDVKDFYEKLLDEIKIKYNFRTEEYYKVFFSELFAAISSLSREYKTVIILRDIEGLNYREIALFLNCEVEYIKLNIEKGRDIIKEKIKDSFEKVYKSKSVPGEISFQFYYL